MKKIILLAMLLFPAVAQAQAITDKPLFTASRLGLAIGVNYEWFAAADDAQASVQTHDKEFTVGLYGAYNLVPQLDFIGFTKYGLDNKTFNSALGLRLVFFPGVE